MKLGEADLSVGTAGQPVTVAAVPFFTSKVGTVTYAAIGDGRMGMRPNPAGVGQMFRSSMDGRAKYGHQWKLKFESSTATSAYYLGLCLRNGTTIRSDVGLRNASGNRIAAFRNDFNYGPVGSERQATGNPMLAGEIWSFDSVVETTGGVTTQVVRVWEGDVNFDEPLPAPTYSWGPVTLAVAPDNFFFGADVVVNVSVIYFDIRLTDGESIVPPAPGTLTFLTNVIADGTDAIEAAVKVANATAVRLEVTPAGGSPVLGEAIAPDTFGYAHPRVEGLAPNSAHSFRVLVDDVQRATGGGVWTDPLPGAPISYRGGWGSCVDSTSTGVYGLIAARGIRHFHNMGDDGYTNTSNTPYGPISTTDEPTRLAQREAWLAAAYAGTRSQLWSAMAVYPNYSDGDGAGANADGSTGGHSNGVVQRSFRRQYALPHLELDEAAFYVVKMGRVWEVHTDETAVASVKTAPDTEAKLKLGAVQQARFFQVIDEAKAAGAVILWFGDGPWVEPAGVGGANGNSWAKYSVNRQVVGAYAEASGVPIRRLHGDTHSLFPDDGTNGAGHIPSISAAPMHTTAQAFGYPISGESYPPAQIAPLNGARQYGIYEVQDDGETIMVDFWGYSSTAAAPGEVERFHVVADMTPSSAAPGLQWVEWNGTTERILTAVEWDGATERPLLPEIAS